MMKSLKTWTNYSKFREDRGRFIADILESIGDIRDTCILDIGCGEGGTAAILNQRGAHVYALDLSDKLAYKSAKINFSIMDALALAFKEKTFDFIIMQDVVEHVTDAATLFTEAKRVLKSDGMMYLCTPNRLSPLNLIADPHWNLPGVSLLSRNWVKFTVAKLLRVDRRKRTDYAALLSYFKINALLQQKSLKHQFLTSLVVDCLFTKPHSIVCNPLHLTIIRLLERIKFDKVLCKHINNKDNFLNKFINPTWFMLIYPDSAKWDLFPRNEVKWNAVPSSEAEWNGKVLDPAMRDHRAAAVIRQ